MNEELVFVPFGEAPPEFRPRPLNLEGLPAGALLIERPVCNELPDGTYEITYRFSVGTLSDAPHVIER